MQEFECLQSYIGVLLAGKLRHGLRVANNPFAKGQRTSEHAPDPSVLDMVLTSRF